MLARFLVRVIATLLSLSSVAGASSPAVQLDAPGDCPSEAELEAFVTSRLSKESTSAPGLRFAVEVSLVGDRHVATLSATSTSGESSQRTLEDPSCVELLKSVAFVIAVAVEREQEELGRRRAAEPPAKLAAPAAPTLEGRASAPQPAKRDAPPAPATRTEDTNPRLSLLAGVRGTSAPAPEFAPAARLAASLSFPAATPAPSIHVSALRTLPQSVGVDPSLPDRGANFTWTAAAIEGCAGTPTGADATVALSGCVGTELGLLSAEGDGVRPSHTRNRFWLGVLALGRLRFPSNTPLGVEVDAGATIPLTRDRFVIEGPKTTVFQPPPIAVNLGLGLSLRVL